MQYKIKFNSLVPEVYVADYRASLAFYVDLLGFTIDYERQGPLFALLSYGDAQLMIQQQEPSDIHTGVLEHPYGRGINFEIYCPDVESLAVKLKEHNYPLKRDVKECWRETGAIVSGSKELQVLDPDGYFLRFSQGIGTKPIS